VFPEGWRFDHTEKEVHVPGRMKELDAEDFAPKRISGEMRSQEQPWP
jgi:hypothetical protein